MTQQIVQNQDVKVIFDALKAVKQREPFSVKKSVLIDAIELYAPESLEYSNFDSYEDGYVTATTYKSSLYPVAFTVHCEGPCGYIKDVDLFLKNLEGEVMKVDPITGDCTGGILCSMIPDCLKD